MGFLKGFFTFFLLFGLVGGGRRDWMGLGHGEESVSGIDVVYEVQVMINQYIVLLIDYMTSRSDGNESCMETSCSHGGYVHMKLISQKPEKEYVKKYVYLLRTTRLAVVL